jgi:hypothetical protein
MADSTRRSFPPAPTAARALLIQGHPRENSFNHALGAAWADGARSVGLDVDVVRAADLDFAPRLLEGTDQPLEPDLADLQDRIARAAHLTLAAPVWWGSTPALVKGLIDRTLQTGWAYGKDHRGNPIGASPDAAGACSSRWTPRSGGTASCTAAAPPGTCATPRSGSVASSRRGCRCSRASSPPPQRSATGCWSKPPRPVEPMARLCSVGCRLPPWSRWRPDSPHALAAAFAKMASLTYCARPGARLS